MMFGVFGLARNGGVEPPRQTRWSLATFFFSKKVLKPPEASNINILGKLSVLFDKEAARLDLIAHE